MSKHDFQLAYTIKPRDPERDEPDAAQARHHLRENLGLDTVEHIETTLLGLVQLESTTTDDRAREAERVVRERIHAELKRLHVLSSVKFYGSLMVSGLGPAIRIDIR
ncbi:hypothetical protein [Pseudomonas oryzicola]|uniref:Uncharacterized protein n=1 Tax=Pseudomonas oryzicola TaxID=485876 RepID=A0ABS6QC01_9PSED|nr:hypothetical protein [Pseudomonas oryzicola]MBV4491732.1 hypothetical protein [Pseudomonas oryzicola]